MANMLFKRIKDWVTRITAFRSGDVIPVDGPDGTAKMGKDDLLKETSKNALAGNVAEKFDESKDYPIGYVVYHDGKLYEFNTAHTAGAWNSSHVSLVSDIACIPQYSVGSDITSSGVVTADTYVNIGGTHSSSNKIDLVTFDVTGIRALRISGGFRSVALNCVQRNSSNTVIASTDKNYTGLLEFDLILDPNTVEVQFNFAKNIDYHVKSLNVNEILLRSYVEKKNEEIGGKIDCNTFADFVNVEPNATYTKGKKMIDDGTTVNLNGACLVEIPTDGHNYFKIKAKWTTRAYSMFQLNSSGYPIETYDLNTNGFAEIIRPILPDTTKLAFNCSIDFVVLEFMNATETAVNSYSENITNNDNEKNVDLSIYHRNNFENPVVPITAYLGNQNETFYNEDSMDADTTYSQFLSFFDSLLTPNYVYKESIGYASDNSEMFVYKFLPKMVKCDAGFTTKKMPSILIVCNQHGFEKACIIGSYFLAKSLVQNHDSSDLIRYIRNNVNLYIVVSANPYGCDNNSYYNANGVNLNRNWGVPNFTKITEPGTQVSGDPFDQPETQNIRDFILAHKNDLDFVIDFHQQGKQRVDIQNINWIDYTDPLYYPADIYYSKMKNALVAHMQNLTSAITEIAGETLLGLTGTEGEETRCGHITINTTFPTTGFCDAWCISRGIMSFTCEGFCAYPTGNLFIREVKQGNEILIASVLQHLLAEYSK